MPNDKKGTGFSLKDELFNTDRANYLAQLFAAADDAFDARGFVRDSVKPFKQLELKERIVHMAATLKVYLASDFRIAAKQIVSALPPPLDPSKTDDDFGDFIFAPVGEFVVRNGMAKKHLKLSLRTLKALTQRFSMEDAIRAFINAHTDETLKELGKWATDKNYHVRRLVSEGTRPLLPWSKRLTIDAKSPLPLLDILYADQTRYVTRSVANHLNDVAKVHPKLVLATLKRWKEHGSQDPKELQWMSKHALRTLVKQGNPQALRFLGFRPNPSIKVTNVELEKTDVKPGDAVEFSFEVTASRDESLMIDYVIDFVKANGTVSPKVHKIKQVDVKRGDSLSIRKRHILRAGATTYTLYPGTHRLTLQINGRRYGGATFELK